MIVLINGLHRSGTMFLSRLVNAFPDTFIVKDGFRIPWYYYRVETKERVKYPTDFYRNSLPKIDLNKKVRDVTHLAAILREAFGAAHFGPEVQEALSLEISNFKQGYTYKEIFSCIFEKLYQVTGCKHIGVKNTHMGFYASDVLEAFANMKWIEIIRDSRGWYCSTKVSHPLSIPTSVRMWNKAVDVSLLASQTNKGRHILITYENLILRGVETLQKICDFLGNGLVVTDEWIKNLKLVENDGSSWHANPSYTKGGKEIWCDQNKRLPNDYKLLDPTPVYRWRHKLPPWEKMMLNLFTSANLKRLRLLSGNIIEADNA